MQLLNKISEKLYGFYTPDIVANIYPIFMQLLNKISENSTAFTHLISQQIFTQFLCNYQSNF